MGFFSTRKSKVEDSTDAPASRASAMTVPAGQAQGWVAGHRTSKPASDAPGDAPLPGDDAKEAAAPTVADLANDASDNELAKHWPVLVLSCVVYILLQAGNAFVPAITMVSSSADLGMSIASFGALNSVGAGIKSVLIIFFMGPALDKYGPHMLINWCLVGTLLCNVALAFCPGALSFSVVYLLNYVFNSLSEQPAYICLYATYFNKLLGVCTTAIASAYSFSGFIIPTLLSPILVAFLAAPVWPQTTAMPQCREGADVDDLLVCHMPPGARCDAGRRGWRGW